MNTTPQVSADLAQAAWAVYETSTRGALAIERDDRADAASGTTCVESTRSTHRQRIPRYACLVRRTGRIAGWRDWRQNRAQANKYSQEERVTSQHSPYAECYVMSNVIGFFSKAPRLKAAVGDAQPPHFSGLSTTGNACVFSGVWITRSKFQFFCKVTL